MRKPTPPGIAYAWHRAVLAGENPPIHESDPHPGWFKRRFVRGGPWVAARIWLDAELDDDGALASDEVLRCEVAGREAKPEDQWTYLASHPITEAEFNFMTADKAWAEVNAPDDPSAQPNRAIDHTKTAIPF